MRAVVVGATSAVGHAIVEALAAGDAWESIVLVVRKQTEDFSKIRGASKIALRIIPSLDDLGTLDAEFSGFDALFCSLGAYLKLDGEAAVTKVDHDYVIAAAALAERCNIKVLSVVSAGGADADLPKDATGFKFYLRTKGVADRAVLEKAVSRIYVYRPGILFGRMSSAANSSTRSKGNWDRFVACFGCCCCCLVRSAGIHIRELGEAIASRAEAVEAECKVILNNAEIHGLSKKFSKE